MPDKRHRTARALSEWCLMGQILFLLGGPRLVNLLWKWR